MGSQSESLKIQFFWQLCLNQEISLDTSLKKMKFGMPVDSTHMEGSLSHLSLVFLKEILKKIQKITKGFPYFEIKYKL